MMLARELPAPARIRNSRTARSATQRRIVANRRNRYAVIVRVTLAIAAAMSVLLLYVRLTSSITALSYAVDQARAQRTQLEMQTARLDDQIASLTSDDRLAAVAAKLGMVQPEAFLRVSLVDRAASGARPLAFLPVR